MKVRFSPKIFCVCAQIAVFFCEYIMRLIPQSIFNKRLLDNSPVLAIRVKDYKGKSGFT